MSLSPGQQTTAGDGSLAAYPDWRVTISQGTVSEERSMVPRPGVAAGVLSLSRIVRQARRRGAGSLSVALSNVADPSTGDRLSDAFSASEPLEGAKLTVRVIAGAVDEVIWTGIVHEVTRLDGRELGLRAVEGLGWVHQGMLQAIEQSDEPLADESALGLGRPVALGAVSDVAPPLVRRPPSTRTAAALTSGATSVLVLDTSSFPASGSLRIDEETLSYASKTPTSFEGLTRSAPTSHATGAEVVEGGTLVYLLCNHALYGTGAVSRIRLVTQRGDVVALPSDVTPTVAVGPPATLTLDQQPTVTAGAGQTSRVCLYDLDTVAHSDLAAAEAEKCIGLADGFEPTNHADLTGAEGTGGQRAATVTPPSELEVSRVFLVIESHNQGVLSHADAVLSGALGTTETTIPVTGGTTGFPSSGKLWIEAVASVGVPPRAELVSYTGKTASSFTGVTRGLNNSSTGIAHAAGVAVTIGSGVVHWNSAGGDASDATALGHLLIQPKPPTGVDCQLLPATHAFNEEAHTHTIPTHTHVWDTSHGHKLASSGVRVDGFLVGVKLGQGGGTGSPLAQGFVSFDTVPFMVAPAITDAHDITHTNVPVIGGGYDRTNWWAVLFPSEPYKLDTRRVLGLDFYLAISGLGGGIQVVTDGVPSGTTNPSFPPVMRVTSHPVIPPEAIALGLTDGLIAQIGDHGTWENAESMTPSSPANGATLNIRPVGSVNPFDVWGGDEGTDDRSSLPMASSGYLRLTDGANEEWITYTGCRWNGSQTELILEGIGRAAFGSTAQTFAVGAGDCTEYPTVGHYDVRFKQVGTMQTSGQDGPTAGELDADPLVVAIYQTELARIFDAHALSKDPTSFHFTMADLLFGRASITPGGSLVPFDENTTNIFEQYASEKIMPRSPILWVRAHTNVQVHAAWMVVQPEDTTSTDLATPSLPSQGTDTDGEASTAHSSLTWFELTDQISMVSDLVGATAKVVRDNQVTQPDPLRLLRMFYVVEVVGQEGATTERPQRILVDIAGAGCGDPTPTSIRGAEAIRQLVVEGLGETAADVLQESSFNTVDPSTQTMAAYLRDDVDAEALETMLLMAEQARLLFRWQADGKLGVAYLPDRDSLPAPSITFTADDVSRNSLEQGRGPLRDLKSKVTVRARYTDLKESHTLTATDEDRSPPIEREYEYSAPHLQDQAGVDDLAEHTIDWGSEVPERVSLRTFTQGLGVYPGDVVGLTHTEKTTTGLFVERVIIDPSIRGAAFVTIEARDLTPA